MNFINYINLPTFMIPIALQLCITKYVAIAREGMAFANKI